MPFNNGYKIPSFKWTEAKKEALEIILSYVRLRKLITYNDLAERLGTLQLEAYDPRLWSLIGDLSEESTREHKFMISAWVVRKDTMEPGGMTSETGFANWGKELGYSFNDSVKFWHAQIQLIEAYYINEVRC